ncbi:MAG: cation:proton antiporter [Gammaproteobacteria bacterium]
MHGVLGQMLAAIGCSVVVVALFRRLGLPAILAYLAVGIILGPYAAGVLEQNEIIFLFGEIGIAFLLFSIGLEFSLPRFMQMRAVLLGLGAAQVAVGTVSGGLIAWAFGTPPAAAIIVGGALAMSSTAIVIKQLAEQVELQAPHGNLAVGILLFQDLAAVPFLVVIPILAGGTADGLLTALTIALAKGVFAVVALLAIGRYALRPLFLEVGSARSNELFTVTVLFVSLFAAWFTEQLGLSLALGAFLAGMMLSETEYRHQIDVELRPFKDMLLGLFFIAVGTQLDLTALPDIWPWVVLLVAGLVLGKGGVIALLAWLWRRDGRVALRTGVVLGHGGEFGFALLAVALLTGLLDLVDAQPILASIIVSMLIAPLLVRHNGDVCERLLPSTSTRPDSMTLEIEASVADKRDHVVLCGFGRVGRQVADLLDAEGVPWVGVDLHAAAIKDAWEDGRSVFYGDASHREVLRALGVERSRAMVVSFDDDALTLKVLGAGRSLAPGRPILVRSRDDRHLESLIDAGANEVIPETLEASLTLAARITSALEIPPERIGARIREVREARERAMREL